MRVCGSTRSSIEPRRSHWPPQDKLQITVFGEKKTRHEFHAQLWACIPNLQVTPPEHAHHYSESLLLFPRTYQANLYQDVMTVKALKASRLSSDERMALR